MNKEFELKEEHVKLLSSTYVGWQDCETGAPAIDPKRPYGNSSVALDIYEVLTGEFIDDSEDLGEELVDEYMKLHEETETALQIILQTKSFEVGTYRLIGFGSKWKKVE